MKRIGNLFNRIISYENLVRAEKKARLGKTKRYGVKKFDRNPYENLVRLQKVLIEDTYRTLLRKDTKKKFIHKLSYKSKNKRLAAMAAYWGWCKYGNCHNLWYRFTRSYNFKDYRQKLLSDDGIKKSTG